MQQRSSETSLVEFKGRMLMVTVLRLTSLNHQQVLKQLTQQLQDGHDWLSAMPIVVDVDAPGEDATALLPGIIDLLHDQQLSLIGLTGNQVDSQLATFLGLSQVNLSGKGKRPPLATVETTKPQPSLLVDHPVRSGQQIYSPGDLIVVSSVGGGAELLAEGNIHVYGNLRGRALAGVQGNTDARVFCQQLNAELISIAGHYRVAEGLPDTSINKAVQISLDSETMHFDPLTSK